ncbi:hypothetical protein [Sphingomonas sp. CV7422]|uniref:hypothetical protein n=1 Tax=Sphingomonas sp. CV7422 TaxID=3018036 RepID=UPI0022FE1E53|nr:hypothetical protein [Sphingomonas sp. CV7422]
MSRIAFAALLACSASVAAQQPPAPPPPAHGNHRTFISPMGQPFHGTDAAPDPERAWFDAADADRDGFVSRAEFQADASRFFAQLDRKHDGEIDPDDIDYYESTVAPEVRSGGGGGYVMSNPDGEGGGKAPSYDAGKLGAARFSYFELPEPVTAADRNFNRGVDAREFAEAAAKRFGSLDTNHDGRLAWDELPHVSGRVSAQDRRRGGGGGGRGGRGGHGGRGGMGGMGSGGFGSPGGDMTGMGRGEE